MRNICIKGLNITLLALITLSTLFSCTLDASASARTTELEKTSRVARMIDETLGSLMSESVAEALDEEGLAELMAITGETEGMDGRGIVARMLEGEDGREILDYTYLAITSQDADEILESARPLVDQDDYLELKSQTAEIKARAMEVYRAFSRTNRWHIVPPEYRRESFSARFFPCQAKGCRRRALRRFPPRRQEFPCLKDALCR